ncbi:MAG: BREX-2 system phosphatase PglZ, partial [Sandaracinaceae bacterium]|nr:BREX-2 system phosphatase PglZ [Sandaracinaceae bacterium]
MTPPAPTPPAPTSPAPAPPAPAPPALAEADLVARLEQTFGAGERERARLIAVHGTWSGPSEVTSQVVGRFDVRAVRSELHLRSLMPKADDGAGIVFVVPWTDRLPLDLAGRFARGGKVQLVGARERLTRMFKVRAADDALRRAPKLSHHMLRYADRTFASPGNVLTAEVLWDGWLHKVVEAPRHDAAAPLARLFEHTLTHAISSAALEVEATPGLRAELEAVLEQRYGPGASIVWRAWERGQSEALLTACVWIEALSAHASDGVVQYFWKSAIAKPFAVPIGSPAAQAFAVLLDALPATDELRRLVERACRAAEAELAAQQMPDLIAAAGASPRLELGWSARRQILGQRLARFAIEPSPAAWSEVHEAFERLRRHRFAIERRDALAQAQMTVRLAAFLLERSDTRVPADDSPRAELKRLARWYVAEGGYVDWARAKARHGVAPGPLGEGVRAVLARVDAIRREMDLAFARGLADWYADGRRGEPLVPIEHATQRFVADFLAEKSERRVLVLLMDGMAWAQAMSLLEDLEGASAELPWGLTRWSAALGRKHEGDFVPVQASLPTLTEISRASFFGGKAFGAKDTRDTSADAKRFAVNAALRALGREPVLFLRRDVSSAGNITAEIQRKIEDRGERVVGIVINAIDEWLSADTEQAVEWTRKSIPALGELLEAARRADRVVLFASDHGHVPGARLEAAPAPTEASTRWRHLDDPSAPLADYEVAFARGRAWAPPGAQGVVLLADEEHRYGSQRRAGAHGGASLAEVLCPTFLIAWDGLRRDVSDEAVELEPRARPAWWGLSPAFVSSSVPARPASTRPASTRPASTRPA